MAPLRRPNRVGLASEAPGCEKGSSGFRRVTATMTSSFPNPHTDPDIRRSLTRASFANGAPAERTQQTYARAVVSPDPKLRGNPSAAAGSATLSGGLSRKCPQSFSSGRIDRDRRGESS